MPGIPKTTSATTQPGWTSTRRTYFAAQSPLLLPSHICCGKKAFCSPTKSMGRECCAPWYSITSFLILARLQASSNRPCNDGSAEYPSDFWFVSGGPDITAHDSDRTSAQATIDARLAAKEDGMTYAVVLVG